MKERFVEWCISRQGIIVIISAVLITLLLLFLTLTGITSWSRIWDVSLTITLYAASAFYHVFILTAGIFILVWMVMGIIKLIKLTFKSVCTKKSC